MLTTQDYSDILTAAIEGGITYWANDRATGGTRQVESIQRDAAGNPVAIVFDKPAVEDVAGSSVARTFGRIVYIEGSRTYVVISAETLAEAIAALAQGEVPHMQNQELRKVCALLHCGDSDAVGDADAEVADVIVQVALFGEVVYG
jgi:hypothetical protein